MSTMKATLVKSSRHYSPDVVSAYHDEDDGSWVACALGIGGGAALGALRGMGYGKVLGPWGLTVGGIVGGLAGGVLGGLTFC